MKKTLKYIYICSTVMMTKIIINQKRINMKKLLLFAVLAVSAICVQAQTADEWTFDPSQFTEGAYSEDLTHGIFTFVCNGKTWELDANKARFSSDTTIVRTHRIKAKSKNNSIKIEAPAAGSIIFCARTGSNSDFARTLVATQGGTELYNAVVCENDTVVHGEGTPRAYYETVVNVPAAGTVEVTMPTGNLNYYYIQFTTDEVVDPDPENPDDPVDPDPEDPADPQPTDNYILNPALIGENTFDTDYTTGIFTLVVVPGTDETKPWVVDANKANFSYDSSVQHTYRIKPGGANNYVKVAAPEAGTLLICPRSGNKDATDRNVVVAQGETVLLDQIVADAQAVDKVYPSYEVAIPAAGEVTITNPTNAINYYYIEFKSGSGVKHVMNLDKAYMSNNVVVANGAEKLYVYNTVGRLVRVVNAEEADLNNIARGIYIVKAVYDNGETQTIKVRR